MPPGPYDASYIPAPFDVIIHGWGFRTLDALETVPYGLPRVSYGISPTFLPRTNVSGEYGDNQQDFWLVMAQNDWSLGEGQRYFRSTDEEARRRFWHGEKINVVVPGEVSLREDIVSDTFVANPEGLHSRGGEDFVIVISGLNAYAINDSGIETDIGAHGAGNPRYQALHSAGGVLTYVAGDAAIAARNGSFAQFSAQEAQAIVEHNNALYGFYNGVLYRYDTAGVATVIHTWRNASGGALIALRARLASLGGDLLILLRKVPYGGAELWSYDGQGVGRLMQYPHNFEAWNFDTMYGVVFIAGRFSRKRTTTEYLPAIYYYANGTPGLLWAADDWITAAYWTDVAQFNNLMVFNDPFRQVINAYNLDTGGIHSVINTASGEGPAFGTAKRFFVFSPGGSNAYVRYPANAIVSTGFVRTSLFDAENTLTKRWKSVIVDADIPTGATVDVAYRLNDLDGAYTTIQTGLTPGTEYLINQDARGISIQVTLNKGLSTLGPKLKRVKVRGAPILDNYLRRTYVLDLTGRNGQQHIQLRDGTLAPKDGHEMAVDLFSAATLRTPILVHDRFASYTGIIDTEGFEVMEVKPEEYVAVVRVREV